MVLSPPATRRNAPSPQKLFPQDFVISFVKMRRRKSFSNLRRHTSFLIHKRSADKAEAAALCVLCHNYIVVSRGAMDNRECSGFILYNYADVFAIGIKRKVARLRAAPIDGCAIAVLRCRAAAVTYYVSAVEGVIEYPIGKAGAIKPVGAYSAR